MDDDARIIDCLGTILLVLFALSCYVNSGLLMGITGAMVVLVIVIINIIDYFEKQVDKS